MSKEKKTSVEENNAISRELFIHPSSDEILPDPIVHVDEEDADDDEAANAHTAQAAE